jgi:hypothetical protein
MNNYSVYYDINNKFVKIGVVRAESPEQAFSKCLNPLWILKSPRAAKAGDGFLKEDNGEFSVVRNDLRMLKIPLEDHQVEKLKKKGML